MISRAASPMACAPVEHAVTTAWFGPLKPWRMETCPETRLIRLAGMKNGLPRRADYALLTRAALSYMDVDPARAGLLPHTERYEHFGDVECFVGDLEPAASCAG
jgi:hypothetical protein